MEHVNKFKAGIAAGNAAVDGQGNGCGNGKARRFL